MKKICSLLIIAALLLMCSAALADAPLVSVSGSAQVSVATDHAVIHLGVRTKAETPTEAQAENKLRTAAVMKALTEDCGIPEVKIATSGFNIYTMSEWIDGTSTEKQFYQVQHQLSVTVADIDKAGYVIDRCVEAGANAIDYVSFEASGMKASVTFISGLAGKAGWEDHAIETGKMISEMSPSYAALLTLMVDPSVPIAEEIRSGRLQLLTPEEVTAETLLMLENTNVTKKCVFRSNHASNYLSLRGDLPDDKESMMAVLREALDNPNMFKDERFRAL